MTLPPRSSTSSALNFLAVAWFVAIGAWAFQPSLAHAAPITLGVMGDSLSDEYAYNGRGYASNWTEQLVNYGSADLGALGSYAAPRYQGYAYNWALSGATSGSLLSDGQASGLAAQIPGAGIQYAVLAIGANDFAPGSSAYTNIYNGTWTPTQINNQISAVLSNISNAITPVAETGVKLVVATIPDYGATPYVQGVYTNGAQRQAVADVVAQVNDGIKALAQSDHLAVADLGALVTAMFGPDTSPNTTIEIGGVTIQLNASTSSNPSTAGFVSDGIHPNTTLQGVLANLFIQALDTGYGAGVPLFSEAQILAHDGLTYGGTDTLNLPYSAFVISYVPEPSTWVLAILGVASLGAARSRARGHRDAGRS